MTSDGDTSNRLSAAIEQIFRSRSGTSTDDERDDDGTYELPEIVPATEDAPATAEVPVAPVLPGRIATAERVAAPAPAPAPEPATAPDPGPTPVAVPATATTSWSDHLTAVPANARSSGLRAPGRRPRVRRVTRVLRHIDPWSTFKVALLFSLVTYLVALTSGVLLWRVADSTGTLDNVERWFTQFGWETFELKGGEVFHNAWIIGLFGVVGLTGGLVLLATTFNLVSDIIGGVRLTVLEEEVVERTVSSTRRYVVRHGAPAAGGAGAPAQAWDVDGDDPPPDTSDPHRATPPAAAPSPEPTADWTVD